MAALKDGAFVVVWGAGEIRGRRYNPNGTPNGDEFQVNTTIAGAQSVPAVSALSNGGFIVVWNSDDGSDLDIFGQRFRPDGTPAGPEFRANTFTAGHQFHPAVAGLSGGGFVIVWQSARQDGSLYGIYGQRYGSHGARLGGEFRFNAYTPGNQQRPSVAALGNGGFVVVWDSFGDGSLGVYGRRFRANGTPLGMGQFRVNQDTNGQRKNASGAGLGENNFVIVWEGASPGGRLFDRGGPIGPEFLIGNVDSKNFEPSVAALNDGRFVVVWSSDREIYGQRFDAAGNKDRGEFHVNTTVPGDQRLPAIAGFPEFTNGRFVVVWQGGCAALCGQRFAD